jgi:uncharacterized repeat protein (TIGR02543 family)
VKPFYRNIIHPLALLFLFAGTAFGQAPDAPTLLSPENGATDIDTAITLLWEAVTNADDYDVQVSTSNDFESDFVVDASGETGTSYDVSGLDYSQTYYWHVRARSGEDFSEWSATWNFTTTDPPTYTITVSANPTEGGTVSGGGTYTHGETVNLQASPATGYTFVNWTEDGSEVSTNANYSFTATGNRTLVANFTANQYTLTINTSGNGSVSKNPDQTTYTHGTEVQLTANAATGWSFSGWSGDLAGITNPATITMDGNKSVTATFVANSYTVTFQTDGTTGASLTGETSQTVTHGGNTSPVTANAPASHNFTNWTGTGGFTSTDNPLTVTNVTGDMTITANYQIKTYTITASAGSNGSISPSGSVVVNHGAVRTSQYRQTLIIPSTMSW